MIINDEAQKDRKQHKEGHKNKEKLHYPGKIKILSTRSLDPEGKEYHQILTLKGIKSV